MEHLRGNNTPSQQDKRHQNRGRAAVMNVVIDSGENGKAMVHWTCPKVGDNGNPCLNRNHHRWYGRDDYICLKCGLGTNIKGESAHNTGAKAGTLV